MSDDTYNYDEELDDFKDCVGFGKFQDKATPADILVQNSGYIVWAWENTTHWIGSEVLVRKAYAAQNKGFRPRNVIQKSKALPAVEGDPIEQFEEAVLDTFGVFPKPHWMY